MSTWLLVDPDSLLRWAWHALSPRLDRGGAPSGALHGLSGVCLRAVEQFRPAVAIAVWEPDALTWRHDLWPAYQAGREEPDLGAQRERARELCAALGWAQVEPTGAAARDQIAALAASTSAPVSLLSADRDLCQRVDERVTLHTPEPAGLDAWTPAQVQARYGVTPAQWAAWRALVGDAGNGLPGVEGVGEKTAAGWLATYGSLDQLLAARLPGKRGAALRAASEQVRAVLEVVRLRADAPGTAPAGGWARPQPRLDQLEQLLTAWDFGDLRRRLGAGLGAPSPALSYRTATHAADVAAAVEAAAEAGLVGLAADATHVAVSPARGLAWTLPAAAAAPLVAALAEGRARFVAAELARLPLWLRPALPAAAGELALATWLHDPTRPARGLAQTAQRWLDLPAAALSPPADAAAALAADADWVRRLEPVIAAALETGPAELYRREFLPAVIAAAQGAALAGLDAGRDEPWPVRQRPGTAGRLAVATSPEEQPVAPPGEELWAMRYVDAAVWLVAGLSGDRALAAALQAGGAGAGVAAALWPAGGESAPAEAAAWARLVGQAAGRGGDAAWLARRLAGASAEANALLRRWERAFPAVARWRFDLAARVQQRGFAQSLAGRRWRPRGELEPGPLAGAVVEAALGDLLWRALRVTRGRARLPLATGWVVSVAAAEGEAAAEYLRAAWAPLADLGLVQPVAAARLASAAETGRE